MKLYTIAIFDLNCSQIEDKLDDYGSFDKTIELTCLGYNLVGVCLQKLGSNVCYLLYYSLNTTLITLYKHNDYNDYYTNAFNRINIFHQI